MYILCHEASVFFDSRSISCWIFGDLDGVLHGSQQTVSTLTSQGWAEALGTTDEQTHHDVSVFLNALSCENKRAMLETLLLTNQKCIGRRSCVKWLTINKDGKAEEIQVFLSTTGVPADVRVALGEKHWTHLQPTACQVCHHLHQDACESMS